MGPRYDIPKAAPEPLRQVQQFVNSTNVESGEDWIPAWLAENGLEPELERARTLREALRLVVLANNGRALDADAVRTVNDAAARLTVQLADDGSLAVSGAHDALDGVVAIALAAMLDGTWARLKACRNCHWSFYDESPNRSATWCSMKLCGNRSKTRTYRRRSAAGRARASGSTPGS